MRQNCPEGFAGGLTAGRDPHGAGQASAVTITTRLAVLFATVLISLAGIVALVSWQSYSETLRDARVAAENLASALDQHTARTIEAIDLKLGIVQLSIERDGLDAFTRSAHPLLAHLAASSPQIRSIVIFDADGRITADSGGAVPRRVPQVVDRSFFSVHRDDPQAGLFISPAFRNRLDGAWTIIVSRRINHADGRFAGVITASMNPNYFRAFYETMKVGANGIVALLAANGSALVVDPWRDDLIGKPIARDGKLPEGKAGPDGTVVAETQAFGPERILAFRRAESLPLIAMVGLARDDALSPWRHQVLVLTGIALGVLGLTALTGLLLGRATARLRASEVLFRALFDASTDGLLICRLGPDDRFRLEACNQAAAAALQAEPDGLVGRRPEEVMPALQAARVEADLRRCLAVGEPIRFESSVDLDSGRRDREIVLVPLRNEKNRLDRVFASFRDITHLRRAEAATRETNRMLLMAEEIAHVGHWRLDVRENRLTWSQEIYRIYGVDPDSGEQTVDSAVAAYHPEDQPVVAAAVADAIAHRRPFTLNLRILRPDGSVRHVVARGLCEEDETGEVAAIFGTLSDVTELRRVEREAAETASLLATTLESMDQGLVVVSPEGRVEICNARAIALLDLPPELMAGKPTAGQVLDHQWAKGEFAGTEESIRHLLQLGSIVLAPQAYTRTRPNGTVIEVRTMPMAGGSLVRTYTDITARRVAEEALRESETRYRLIAENVSDVITRLNLDLEWDYVSPACRELLGYEPEDLVGTKPLDGIHPDDRACSAETFACLTTGLVDTATSRQRCRRRDGSYVWVEARIRLLRGADGAPSGYVASLRDVSERQQQAEALEQARDAAEQASRAKTDFLALMSHEIRTPLNGILGYTDLLLEDATLGEGQRRQAERIQSAGAALLTIVNDILDFSKIEAGQVELDPRPFLLDALVDNTISVVRGFVGKKAIAISTVVDPDVPRTLVGDQDRLRQVLLNLLNNAVKFTHAGSVTLSVSCLEPAGATAALRFSVTDTGIGIPEDKRGRLFQRFSQLDSSIGRDFGGTGLGLAISKNLVELMGGTIDVESEVSKGTTFWFTVTLPVGGALTAPSEPSRAAAGTAPARVLLVEDLEINQDIARAVLEGGGHLVDVANDGLEAIVAVQTKDYDLVLMDVQMPGMDGIAATRHIRRLPHRAHALPIIAMTANVLPAQIAEFRAAGMDDHVGKPFKRDDLLRAIARWAHPQGRTRVPNGAGPEEPILDRHVFEDLRSSVGPEGAAALLARLVTQIEEHLAEPRLTLDDGSRLARDAHAIVGAAGMLGFIELSRACAELEIACQRGLALDPAVARVRAARRHALTEIEGLRAPA